MATKLSEASLRVLRSLAAGGTGYEHCRTMSDHGGMNSTLSSLHRKGLMDKGVITDAGRAAVAPPKATP